MKTFKGLGNLQVIRVPSGETVTSLIAKYRASGLVDYAEPDYEVHIATTEPNDPRYLDGSLWGLNNYGQSGGKPGADIDAPEAWDILTSASNIVVAVVDTGVRYTHEDLASNMWVNPVDGTHGYNALADDHNPWDENGHGTFLAGVLGASGNNGKGVTGVAWDVQIMACKFLDSSGNGFVSDALDCIEFARTNGARIMNLSWGGPDAPEALSNAIATASQEGIIFAAAAGNNGHDTDVQPFYPASFDHGNIVSVAASDRSDNVVFNSDYGATSVDLFAPGYDIWSSFFLSDSWYFKLSGTSVATPYVAGSLALMLDKFPGESPQQIIQRLLDGVDPVPAFVGKCVTGGRLNLKNALSAPVRLTVLPRKESEPFALRVSGGSRRVCVIEVSTDSGHWAPIAINTTGDSGFFDFTDPESTNATRRFYRAKASP